MAAAHDRLRSQNGWTIDEVEQLGGMNEIVTLGAKFYVVQFGAKSWLELAHGFHPSLKRHYELTEAKLSDFPGSHPPHKNDRTPEPDMFSCELDTPAAGKVTHWLLLSIAPGKKDIATIGTPGTNKNHGGAHGVDS